MTDLNNMSDEERELLEETAKAKGMTLEEVLVDLGHAPAPEHDQAVSLTGTKQTESEAETPAVAAAPIQIAEEEPQKEEEDLAIEVEPEIEPPPPPAAEDDEPYEPEDDEESEQEEDDQIRTAAHICSQCGWDQSLPVIPEPEHRDKLAFLHAVLGHKVFSKRYSMFGNNLRVTFRTLTIREIDALYQEAYKAQKDGKVQTPADYYEYINRLRLYLQLIGVSAKTLALHAKLPEGLSVDTHRQATSHWDAFLREQGNFNEEQSLISQIENYMIENVLQTEHLQRTITHECNKFNRLVTKLEACVDNPDFWNETEQPS